MVPDVLSATTKHAVEEVAADVRLGPGPAEVVEAAAGSGSANGLPMKISVLLLNDARNIQISGAMTSMAQTARAMCARPLNSLISRSAPACGCAAAPGSVPRRGAGGAVEVVIVLGPAHSSIGSRRVTRRVSAANVMVRKNSATPIAEA